MVWCSCRQLRNSVSAPCLESDDTFCGYYKVTSHMPDPKFEMDKLGGCGCIVQVDETMLNKKPKMIVEELPIIIRICMCY